MHLQISCAQSVNFEISPVESNLHPYEALYNGESIDFDLLDGKVCMVMDKSGNVHYKSSFDRKVKATSEL